MTPKPWLKHYDEGVPHSLAYPEITLPEMLSETAERYPDKTATIFNETRMTYGQLQAHVEAFAAGLSELGVVPGDKVGIILPNCPQTVIAFYAVLRLGGIAVMTNPQYVERELEHQWHDAGVMTVIALDRLLPRIQRVESKVGLKHSILVSLQDIEGPTEISRERDTPYFRELLESGGKPPEVMINPSDIACLQYTGGTTGLMKGVVLTHHKLIVNVTQACEFIFFKAKEGEERYLALMPFFHAYGLTAVMNVSVRKAAAMIILPRFEIDAVMEAIREHQPTIFAGVPTMFIALNHASKASDLASIRSCFSGAAPLPLDVLETFERRTGARIAEGYGMTEASPVTHVNPMYGLRKPGSVGLPLPDTEARIMDAETGTRTLEPGEVGEIVIQGPQVMDGYWNAPGETEKTLRDGWLFTGDFGRVDEDGYLYILDRKKDMILTGGYNVYPREIDEVLFMHPNVREAVAVGIPDAYRGETIKAYVVLYDGSMASPEGIIEHCRENLAEYKVPRAVEFRAALPKTMVGKVLRRALRDDQAGATNTVTVTLPVRYSECDPLGIAHHSSYVIWFEEVRHEYRRRHQADYDQLAEYGVFMPLAELRVRYRSPARFGDIVIVRSWMTEVRSRKATFYHEVRRNGTEEILAEGETVHICFDVKTGELKKIPPRVIGLLEKYLKTPSSQVSRSRGKRGVS